MTDCIFCLIVRGDLPATRVYEDETVLAFMDIHPLRRGHVLIVPKVHAQQLHDLPAPARHRLVDTGARVAAALYASPLAPAAVHYMVNDGPAAHQTVPHVHLHVLPRYRGDAGRFLLRLLRKPLDPVLGPLPAERLAADAAAIRAGLQAAAQER